MRRRPPAGAALRLALVALAGFAVAAPARGQAPQLYYEADGAGTAVVLIPSWAHDTATWFRVLPGLREGHRLVRYDLRGQGRSETPVDGEYGLAAQVDDLLRVLDGLGIERAHLVGAGVGARIAVGAAIERPERVISLALLEPELVWTDDDRAWWGRFLDAHERIGEPSMAEYTAVLVGRWFDPSYLDQEPWVVPFYDLGLRRQAALPLVAALRAWLGGGLAIDVDRALPVPVLVVRGEGSGQPRGDADLSRAFPDFRRAWLPGTGRIPQIESPEALVEALTRHFEGAEARRAVAP